MTRNEARLERFRLGIDAMSASEREAMKEAMTEAARQPDGGGLVKSIIEIGTQRGRAVQRSRSDTRTDRKRRGLVGARLPLEQVQRCKDCAQKMKVSRYRFAADALEAACKRAEEAPIGESPANALPDLSLCNGGQWVKGCGPG